MGVSKSWRGGEHTRLPPKPVSRSGDVAALHWLWPAQNERSIKHTLMEESVLVGLGQVVAFTVIFVRAFASHSVVSQSTGDFTAWNSISVLMVTDRRRSELISSASKLSLDLSSVRGRERAAATMPVCLGLGPGLLIRSIGARSGHGRHCHSVAWSMCAMSERSRDLSSQPRA